MGRKRYCSVCGEPSVETLQRRRSGVGIFTLYGCEKHSGLILYDYMDAWLDGGWRPRNMVITETEQGTDVKLL